MSNFYWEDTPTNRKKLLEAQKRAAINFMRDEREKKFQKDIKKGKIKPNYG